MGRGLDELQVTSAERSECWPTDAVAERVLGAGSAAGARRRAGVVSGGG